MKSVLQLRVPWIRQEHSSAIEEVELKTRNSCRIKLDFFRENIVDYIS